jgi:N-succinyldiaminopimelate aminotransferase
VADQLDEREIWGFLEDCLDDGLLLAPGPSFGEDYASWIRICFTSAPPEKVARACTLLSKRLG